MITKLRALLVDLSQTDSAALIGQLRRVVETVDFTEAGDGETLHIALDTAAWDVVLCSWDPPSPLAVAAMELVGARGIAVPVIAVLENLSEETAVSAMRAGASDVLLRSRLERLPGTLARMPRRLPNRDQDSMVATVERVAHDYNNVLALIVGYCDLLHEALDPADVRRAETLEIRAAVQRGTMLTQQLLAAVGHPALNAGADSVQAPAPHSHPTVSRTLTSPVTACATVLLVDDEQHLREVTREILVKNGYHVIEAGDGLQALEASLRHPHSIDVLLTDLTMPNLDGAQLAHRMHASRPATKVVFMSGHADTAVDDTAVPWATFLQKPLTAATLTGALRRLLGH